MIDISYEYCIFLLLGCISCLMLIAIQTRGGARNFIIITFLFALTLRLCILLLGILSIQNYGSSFFLFDDAVYDATANDIAAALSSGSDGFISGYTRGFPNPAYFNLGGFTYHYLGGDTFTMRILNVLISCVTVLPLYKLTQENISIQVARRTIVLYTILPMMSIYSGLQIKDIFVNFFLVCCLLHVLRIVRKSYDLWDVALPLLYLLILWLFKRDLTASLAVLITITLLIFNNPKWPALTFFYQYWKIAILGIMSISLMILIILNTELGDTLLFSMEFMYATQATHMSDGGVGASNMLRISSLAEAYKIPFAMVFVILAPLPGSIELITRTDVVPFYHSFGNIFSFLILPLVIVGLLELPKYLRNLALWLVMSILNLGTVRYALTIWIFCAIWAAVGINHLRAYPVLLTVYFLALIVFVPPVYYILYF